MDLSRIYPKREDWVHKGYGGHLLVVAGSKLYTGSPVFNAVAAMRAGCDLVTIVSPKRAADVAATQYPDFMTYPLEGDYFSQGHVAEVLKLLKIRKATAAVIGCGMGREEATLKGILKLIKILDVPMVLDADALRALSTKKGMKAIAGKKVIITPHAGEFEALTGEKLNEDPLERQEIARAFARKYDVVVILKGYIDIVCTGGSAYLNNTGSPLMTKGGFGDTLAGITSAFLARGISTYEAAIAGAFINGKAGELAVEEKGEGVLASDIFDYIPQVFI